MDALFHDTMVKGVAGLHSQQEDNMEKQHYDTMVHEDKDLEKAIKQSQKSDQAMEKKYTIIKEENTQDMDMFINK